VVAHRRLVSHRRAQHRQDAMAVRELSIAGHITAAVVVGRKAVLTLVRRMPVVWVVWVEVVLARRLARGVRLYLEVTEHPTRVAAVVVGLAGPLNQLAIRVGRASVSSRMSTRDNPIASINGLLSHTRALVVNGAKSERRRTRK
jgi:hypothetical protein